MRSIDIFASRLHEHLSRAGIAADQRPDWLSSIGDFDRERAKLILAGADTDFDIDELELIAGALKTTPAMLLFPYT
jgi:hypothetical protein